MNQQNTQKHTPGPWKVSENISMKGFTHLAITTNPIYKSKDWFICSITPQHLKREADEANARLIAAAPELLRALKNIANDIYYAEFGNTPEYEQAQQAIAKAEGK